MRLWIRHHVMCAYLRCLLRLEKKMPGTMWMFKSCIELEYEDDPLTDELKSSAEICAKKLHEIKKAMRRLKNERRASRESRES